MVKNKNEIIKLITERKADINKFGVKKVGLFGSFVRGEETLSSDVDLLVEFSRGEKNFRNYIGFAEFAEKILGRNVDVLTEESLSPHLVPYIKRGIEYVETA